MGSNRKRFSLRYINIADFKRRYNFFIFLLCMAVAAITWFMIKLSREYTTEVVYPLNYINFAKKNMLIGEAPENMTVLITANGYKLAKMKYLNSADTLNVDVSRIKLRKEGDCLYGFVRAKDVIQLNSQILPYKRVTEVKPDTLFLEFESVASKKVSVQADLSLDFARGYEQVDSIVVIPEKVTLKGSALVINSVETAVTESVKIKDIRSNKKIYLKLLPAADKSVAWFEPDSVKILVSVKHVSDTDK